MPTLKSTFATGILLLTYGLLFYFMITQQLNVDFSGFYSSSLAYLDGSNPYSNLQAPYLSTPTLIATNLNPPIFLLLFSPITYFSYTTASIIWGLSSLILGSIGTLICFYLTSSSSFFKAHRTIFVMLYLALYSTLMNTSYNQIAGFLLFFIMAGYYFYQRNNEYAASLLWGGIIAIKLFPALLFILMLSEKRYKVFLLTLITTLILWSLPLLSSGTELYLLYFKTLNQLGWYGNSWNASVYGVLFRLFGPTDHVLLIKLSYLLLSTLLFLWYLNKLGQLNTRKIKHAAFSLTLIMMLLLSPLGWMYYFSLLILPLIVIYQALSQSTTSKTGLWFFCLLALNTPIANIQSRYIPHFIDKITLYSLYFYGLITMMCLFVYALKINPHIKPLQQSIDKGYLVPLKLIIYMDVFIVLSTLLVQLSKAAL